MAESVERRLIFGSVADRYDRHRPSYPAQLVDAVLDYARAAAGDRALEVGAGTGIATRQFAARGLAITAVEPDAEMAAVASRPAATDGTSIDVRITDFEHLEFEPDSFRLVYSGTAWHWVAPELRYGLAARALAPGGALAAFWNRPVREGSPIRSALVGAYESVADAFVEIYPGPMNPTNAIEDISVVIAQDWESELADAPQFSDLRTQTFRWTTAYTRDEYVGLLGTHSDHLLLSEPDRGRLFDGVAAAIDAAGGGFELTYEALLCLARAS